MAPAAAILLNQVRPNELARYQALDIQNLSNTSPPLPENWARCNEPCDNHFAGARSELEAVAVHRPGRQRLADSAPSLRLVLRFFGQETLLILNKDSCTGTGLGTPDASYAQRALLQAAQRPAPWLVTLACSRH
jgi:hypothetical protein